LKFVEYKKRGTAKIASRAWL